MSERKFQVGDLVVCVLPNGGDECYAKDGPKVGMEGVVQVSCPIGIMSGKYGVVFWQHTSSMHALRDKPETMNGWWCTEDSLEFAEPETDGDITVQNLDLILEI